MRRRCFYACLHAFNLVAMIRGEIEESTGSGWDLARVQSSLLKAGARVNTSGRRLIVDVARAAMVVWQCLIQKLATWLPCPKNKAPKGPRPQQYTPPPAHAHLHLVLRL